MNKDAVSKLHGSGVPLNQEGRRALRQPTNTIKEQSPWRHLGVGQRQRGLLR